MANPPSVPMRFDGIFRLFLLGLAVFNISCSPTYPKERVVDGVKRLCQKEYGTEVEVAVAGSTLGVRMPIEGLFDEQTFQINTASFDKITGVMLSVSRVALSSDKSIDFYTVIAYDKNSPGAEVAMTRYVHDLRRFFLGDISRGEFAKRMIFDVRFNPQGVIDTWFGSFTLKEHSLPDFIISQANHRILDEFRENKDMAGRFKVVSCQGAFNAGELVFMVDISREGLPMSEYIHGRAWRDSVLEICAQKIAHVLCAYDFYDITGIKVINSFDNSSTWVPSDQINQCRKRSIRID
ncbi:MAG: hypothetical protein PHV77_06810 [Candidatus Omnitrophica bacterium]|nr:hypothetical protein [Candidatus Omnitrophota bacterium]